MRKSVLPLLLAGLLFSIQSNAQSFARLDSLENWKIFGNVSILFNQASFSNWAAGGENSFSGLFVGLFDARYKKNKQNLNLKLDGAYGMTKIKGDPLQKTEDRFNVVADYGYEFKKHWLLSSALDFRTQFAEGLSPDDDSTLISNFMSPGYLIASLGIRYQPKEWFSIELAPVTGKFTFVTEQTLADRGEFGVTPAVIDTSTGTIITPGENVRSEFGGYLSIIFNKEIIKNVTLESRLEVFTDYSSEQSRGEFDVNFRNVLDFKINKYLSTNLILHLYYDEDVKFPVDTNGDGTEDGQEARVQFKQVLGLGVTYKFGRAPE